MRLRSLLISLVCLFLLACGGARLAQRGDQQLAGGHYDDAIASYEAAARASAGDPVEAASYRKRVAGARTQAARQTIAVGDAAFRDKNLKAAGDAYTKARGYAPTDALVVDRLSTLLKTRVRVEADQDAAWKELNTLQRADTGASRERWESLVSAAERLLAWRRDYPRTKALWDAVAAPAGVVLLEAARASLSTKQFAEARLLAEKALRLSPNDAEAKALLDQIDRSGSASAHAADAAVAQGEGRLDDALDAYHLALEQNPNDTAAKAGQRATRAAYVRARMVEARRLRKKHDRRGELLALRAAWAVNTDDKKLSRRLRSAYDRAHKRAITAFYRAGRKHESGHRCGAALIAYRTAVTLGGGPKDLSKRIARCTQDAASGQVYRLSLSLQKTAKGVLPSGANAVLVAVRRAIKAAKLDAIGVQITEDSRLARKADGSLSVEVPRFALPRDEAADPRKKKFLDRVEFPPNPAWSEAQARQSAALAALNGVTDRLRPLQDQVNGLEARLATLDEDLVKLKARIRAEDATYYARQPKPCADGTTSCPQSYANKRWAKHITWHKDQVAKTNGKIAKLSPDYSAAREAVAAAQEGFDKAERAARETPAKLRKEIWKDHAYTVLRHTVTLQGTARLRWHDRGAKAELAANEAKLDAQEVDFSSPGVIIRKQTLEPPRLSKIPADDVLVKRIAEKLVAGLVAVVWPKLRLHGERFVLRAKAERRAAVRLDLQVRALSTGKALSAASRQALRAAVLTATGYDWETMAVDLGRVVYR